RIISYNPPPK
ncbi:Cytoplasmic protein, partial [Monkeypox virus]